MFPLLHGRRWWHFRRFEGLLLSLACMFLLNIIFPGKIYGGTAQACYLPLQLLAGINLYGRLRPGFWAAALTAAGILALHPFQALSSMPRALQFSLLLLHGLFFFIILLEVFIQLYRAQTHRLQDLFYFSYISLMTIGYGDITPVSWAARNATVLVSLSANIYSLVVIASIVGRTFASRPGQKADKEPAPKENP